MMTYLAGNTLQNLQNGLYNNNLPSNANTALDNDTIDRDARQAPKHSTAEPEG